jgi:tRNA modification GTPase
MSRRSPLQVVQLTPPGRGAVATLLVEGPGAVEIVRSKLSAVGRPQAPLPVDRPVLRRFASESGEEVVVRRRPDDAVELHCHGGHAAVAMIERALVDAGCRAVGWRDWVADHHRDPIAAAACEALAEARTERTAAILLDQYHGALRRALDEIERAIGRNDFPSARKSIEALLARADVGRHLVRPWRVVLAGGANVGKSSLINALVGYQRAIVHHAPGTTRDVVTAGSTVEGWPVELSDTAGLRASGDAVERAGVELARERLSAADLVILVFDISAAWEQSDRALVASWPDGLIVHNKCDLPPVGGGRPPGVVTSALTGEGMEGLVRGIADRLVRDPPPPGAAVPFAPEHFQHLTQLSRLGCPGD